MTFPLSRAMSAATASYGVFALVKPRHLGSAMTRNRLEQPHYDTLALTYGARDITVSAVALLGRSASTVTTAMVVRIAFDIADGTILAVEAHDGTTRTKVLGVTLGGATLNTVALVLDRRSVRR